MKVAFISAIPVVPAFEGNKSRILNLCRAVKQLGHDVYFIHPKANPGESLDVEGHISEFGEENFIVLSATSIEQWLYRAQRVFQGGRRRLQRLLKLESGYYFDLDEFYGVGFDSKYRRLHSQHKFDLVCVEYVFHSAALDAFPDDVRKLMDTHDTFADRHKSFNGENYWYSIPPAEQVRGFKRADAVIAIQEDEAERFRQDIGGDRPEVSVVSHFLDISRQVTDFSSQNAVFVGSSNSANVFSLNFFIDQVLPKILDEIPLFRLKVAGSICKAIGDHHAVDKIGFVDHVSDAFQQAQISINPSLLGTGINIKLLDALAAGVPTVATYTGMRGLPDRYREGVFVVDDNAPDEFARQVVSLARDPLAREQEGRKAYEAARRWNADQSASLAQLLANPSERQMFAAQ